MCIAHMTVKCHGLKTMGPPIHVDVTLTRTMCLSTVAERVHQFMETVLSAGCGLFLQDNAPCHKVKMVQEWPQNSPDPNLI